MNCTVDVRNKLFEVFDAIKSSCEKREFPLIILRKKITKIKRKRSILVFFPLEFIINQIRDRSVRYY